MAEYHVITTVSSPNKNPRRDKVTDFVIHATVGSFFSAVAWLKNPASKVSSHYVISKTGVIYQMVDPVTEVAWHAGRSFVDGKITDLFNNCSVSYELENKNNGFDIYPAAQLDALTWLVQYDMKRFDVPLQRIHRHLDVCWPRDRKSDPAGFPWDSWRERLGMLTDPGLHVTVARLNVRSGPGISFPVVAQKKMGDNILPLEIKEGDLVDGNSKWARIDLDQWISMRYLS